MGCSNTKDVDDINTKPKEDNRNNKPPESNRSERKDRAVKKIAKAKFIRDADEPCMVGKVKPASMMKNKVIKLVEPPPPAPSPPTPGYIKELKLAKKKESLERIKNIKCESTTEYHSLPSQSEIYYSMSSLFETKKTAPRDCTNSKTTKLTSTNSQSKFNKRNVSTKKTLDTFVKPVTKKLSKTGGIAACNSKTKAVKTGSKQPERKTHQESYSSLSVFDESMSKLDSEFGSTIYESLYPINNSSKANEPAKAKETAKDAKNAKTFGKTLAKKEPIAVKQRISKANNCGLMNNKQNNESCKKIKIFNEPSSTQCKLDQNSSYEHSVFETYNSTEENQSESISVPSLKIVAKEPDSIRKESIKFVIKQTGRGW